MMIRSGRPRWELRAWRVFSDRDGHRIERSMQLSTVPLCPQCGGLLEAEPGSRLKPRLVLDATAWDLTCRECRRFWSIIRHTPRSLHLIRMRRFAAAVRAAPSLDHSWPAPQRWAAPTTPPSHGFR